jgi:hypothetical protein
MSEQSAAYVTMTTPPMLPAWQTELLRQITRNRSAGKSCIVVCVYDAHTQSWRVHHDSGAPTIVRESA